MGSYWSSPSNGNNPKPSDEQVKNKIISLKETSQDDADNFTIDNEQLNRFREILLSSEYKPSYTGGARRRRKPAVNKYKKYDITPYLESLKQTGGGDQGFEPMTEIEGLDELRKIINSIEEEQSEVRQTGGNRFSETSPLTEGIRAAMYKLQHGGNDDSSSSTEEEIAKELEDDEDDEATKEKMISEELKESGFSETSPFYGNNDSFTVSSVKEDSIETKAATINVLPFYSSESSSSFQHPYTKSRFN
jgi:hypothetical protein